MRKLESLGQELVFVYEAGPCGLDVYHLERMQPSHPVTPPLARYMSEKSAGYGPNERLLQAFSTRHSIRPDTEVEFV